MLELLTRRPVTAEFCCQYQKTLHASRVFSAPAYWILRALAFALPFCLVSLRSESSNHRTTPFLGWSATMLSEQWLGPSFSGPAFELWLRLRLLAEIMTLSTQLGSRNQEVGLPASFGFCYEPRAPIGGRYYPKLCWQNVHSQQNIVFIAD